jgi:hypothetical protein
MLAGFAEDPTVLVDAVGMLEPPPQPAKINAAATRLLARRVHFGKSSIGVSPPLPC